MTVTLSKELEEEVKTKIEPFDLESPEKVIEVAMQRWQADEFDPEWLEAELLQGVNSPTKPWTRDDFEALRTEVRTQAEGK